MHEIRKKQPVRSIRKVHNALKPLKYRWQGHDEKIIKGILPMKSVVLNIVERQKRILFLDYLLLADESEEIVKEYINDGEMFSIHYKGNLAGVVLFTFHPNQTVELKNLALAEEYRGSGIGKSVMNEVFEIYRAKGLHQMIVGTANSSISNLAFYQKAGFRILEIKKGFFKKYPTPIYENGIQALDMVMFKKDLRE